MQSCGPQWLLWNILHEIYQGVADLKIIFSVNFAVKIRKGFMHVSQSIQINLLFVMSLSRCSLTFSKRTIMKLSTIWSKKIGSTLPNLIGLCIESEIPIDCDSVTNPITLPSYCLLHFSCGLYLTIYWEPFFLRMWPSRMCDFLVHAIFFCRWYFWVTLFLLLLL